MLARLDIDSGRLTWVNAGHPAPLILRDRALIRPARLPVGAAARPAGPARPRVRDPPASPATALLLYTDGIVEARSPAGEFFGEERLADFVVRAERGR